MWSDPTATLLTAPLAARPLTHYAAAAPAVVLPLRGGL